MKSLFFHLMPYAALPEDFSEKYSSVWVDIDKKLFNPELAHAMYHDYLDELQYADELGFDGICVNEHHSNGYGMMSSPQMMATAMARSTHNAAILVLGSSIALYDPPMRVAEDFATVDVMSGGRLIAGFPIGTPFDTCYAMGQNPSSVRTKYREAHDIIMRCWLEKEMFAYNGEYYKQPYINPFLQPVQKPHPPIWVPGGGAVETWAWAAEKDYAYTYTSYFGYKAAQAQIDGYWKAVEAAGRDRNPFRLGFLQFIGVAETREEAYKLYQEPGEFFYNAGLKVDARWGSPPGYVTEATMRAKFKSQTQRAAMQQEVKTFSGRMTMDYLVDMGYLLIGSPDEVAAQIREAAKNLNFGQLLTLLQFGNMNRETAFYNTEMFAKYVMPQIKDIWEDKWENRWWPTQTMPKSKRSVARLPAEGNRNLPDRPEASS